MSRRPRHKTRLLPWLPLYSGYCVVKSSGYFWCFISQVSWESHLPSKCLMKVLLWIGCISHKCIYGSTKTQCDGVQRWDLWEIIRFKWGNKGEIKRCLLLGRKVMTNLDSIFKSRDITLPTKVRLVKAMVFPVVMYGCESWTVKKAECRRIDAFELWCWRRLLRVPWTARRSN